MAYAVHPADSDCRTTARTAALIPGESPPEVMTAMRFFPHGIEGGLRLTCAMLGGGGAGGAGGGGSSSRRCWCQMSMVVSWVLVKCESGLKGEIVGEDGKMARYSTLWLSRKELFFLSQLFLVFC